MPAFLVTHSLIPEGVALVEVRFFHATLLEISGLAMICIAVKERKQINTTLSPRADLKNVGGNTGPGGRVGEGSATKFFVKNGELLK